MKKIILTILFLTITSSILLFAQKRKKNKPVKEEKIESIFSGLKLRSVGPAFASGRIADIAVHPDNDNEWYVATGSGGVWKTKNSGHTWKPIFDNYTSYSTGCITLDPSNPATIWLGTGENVGGRHVAYGDGVYKSTDGGESWKNMGLKESEHISEIIVHPENSNIIWVAAQGPLWKSGDERGLYKSMDGGMNWKKVLGNSEWTGVTDIAIDPRNADVIYAATWDRHRTIAAFMGGGPGSGLHRSRDGGETWTKLKTGLPKSNLGKIGIAISPQQPDVIYAAIELDRKTGGVYRSANQGASWRKMSNAVSGATGPHYYQELYASPHAFDRIYLMNVRILVSENGGGNFRTLTEEKKHSDNHAIIFRRDDPNYLLVGTDAGIYESFDLAKNWRFIPNLPLTQYYKVAVDDREPFYHIFGGTQDNGSHGGPSRTDNRHGIRNQDWYKTLGADGHQSATEPGNPNIIYAETQQGGMHRVDLKTGEQVFIQPQAGEGEGHERFNWDAPILVSSHDPKRLYFASQRVWKSKNRGDGWEPISEDLTLNQERMTFPYYDTTQSWDNAWDVGAMSNYNTITSLAESPKQEGLLYAGTDDGLIQVTEDEGANWNKISLNTIKGVPATPFVNDVRADLFDANVVYAALDNHKYGDYKPYIIKSTDKGRSWRLINGDLPNKLLIWRLVQDHINKDLLFAATEFGVYFTSNGGKNWIQLKGGMPTIPIRDIKIQRRENDLVAGSFGRGIFILDDITPLRTFNKNMMSAEATMFPVKKVNWYRQSSRVGSQGDAEWIAKNPPFGANFTYYMADKIKSKKDLRKAKEKKGNAQFPGWDALEEESREDGPSIMLVIKDKNGNVVNTIKGTNRKGFNRVNWRLNYPSKRGERLQSSTRRGFNRGGGIMVTPGTYSVTLEKRVNGVHTTLQGPVNFEVVPLFDGTLPRKSNEVINNFREDVTAFQQDLTSTNISLSRSLKTTNAMLRALNKASRPTNELFKKLNSTKISLLTIDKELNGDSIKDEIGERSNPSASDGGSLGWTAFGNTYGPTDEHMRLLNRVKSQLKKVKNKLYPIVNSTLPSLRNELIKTGAPWIEGQGLIND